LLVIDIGGALAGGEATDGVMVVIAGAMAMFLSVALLRRLMSSTDGLGLSDRRGCVGAAVALEMLATRVVSKEEAVILVGELALVPVESRRSPVSALVADDFSGLRGPLAISSLDVGDRGARIFSECGARQAPPEAAVALEISAVTTAESFW
jgi:hypothetical protein